MASLKELLEQVETSQLDEACKKKGKKKSKKKEKLSEAGADNLEMCANCNTLYDTDENENCPSCGGTEIVKEAFEAIQDECEEKAFEAGLDPRGDTYGDFMTFVENCKKEKQNLGEATINALESILEMVEEDALTKSETEELMEAIEDIFNNLLESVDEDYEEEDDYYSCTECDWSGYESEMVEEDTCPECGAEATDDESYIFTCNDDDEQGCDWEGSEDELVENEDGDLVCPHCGSSVSEVSYEDEDDYEEDEDDYEEDEELEEGMMLKKSTAAEKKAAKAYARSAKGKKTLKLQAKKRKKYATKISRCSEKGKTFSFREMTCIKSKKRR